MKTVIVCILSTLVLLPGGHQPQQPDGGTVSGRIFLPAKQSEERSFRGRIYRDRLVSRAKQRTRRREAAQSSYLDVIVSLHPLTFRPDTEPMPRARVIQKDATFFPRVTPITPGTIIEFVNRDRFYHNVFSITPRAKFNIGRRPTGDVSVRRINRLGEVKLFCDIHSQMNATILSLDTPYFIRAKQDGGYELNDLPAGSYELRIYHPDFPTLVDVVDVEPNGRTNRNFTMIR